MTHDRLKCLVIAATITTYALGFSVIAYILYRKGRSHENR
jgi:hypothetical protein